MHTKSLDRYEDPLGLALSDYMAGARERHVVVFSPDFDDDQMPVDYFFRKIDDMPRIEQKALSMCKGRILDAGAGAGCHSLELQKSGFDVTSIDISPLAAEVMEARGLRNVICQSLQNYKGHCFDTILLMMNGIGISGTIEALPGLLGKMHSILNYGGRILLDSSDLRYLLEDEDGSFEIDIAASYYGEVEFTMLYDGTSSQAFKWLYIDYGTLEHYAEQSGFSCSKVMAGSDSYSYLACLKKI
jgi:SAM-dependent methyltransferase